MYIVSYMSAQEIIAALAVKYGLIPWSVFPPPETPIADYYILAGVVYQAPDLCSVSNSRMVGWTGYCLFRLWSRVCGVIFIYLEELTGCFVYIWRK